MEVDYYHHKLNAGVGSWIDKQLKICNLKLFGNSRANSCIQFVVIVIHFQEKSQNRLKKQANAQSPFQKSKFANSTINLSKISY